MTWQASTVCPHESDVLDLVLMEQWPARAEHSLVAHVDGCATCRDLITSVSAIVQLRDDAPRPQVPDASIVWHRTQLRARYDAARQAARPMFAAQMVALTAFIGVGVLWIMTGAAGLETAWQWITRLLPSSDSVTIAAVDVAPGVWTTARWAAYAILACAIIGLLAFSVARFADDTPEEKVRS